MPAGMSWPRYISFCAVAFMTSLAGAQIVHLYYKPLDDLDDLVQQELDRRKKLREMSSVSS